MNQTYALRVKDGYASGFTEIIVISHLSTAKTLRLLRRVFSFHTVWSPNKVLAQLLYSSLSRPMPHYFIYATTGVLDEDIIPTIEKIFLGIVDE